MTVLACIGKTLQDQFPNNRHGRERSYWFLLTLQAILVPITISRTSNLLRAIETLFGVVIPQWRYYTFMASVKLPWQALWESLWHVIPNPLVEGRLICAADDSINPKTGGRIFACQKTFDHAAKPNQVRWPWAQTLVVLGLLLPIHGRWCCLPLAFRFYLQRKTIIAPTWHPRRKPLVFQDKFSQVVAMLTRLRGCFPTAPILVVTDSWFGNNGLFRPMRAQCGINIDLLARMRINAVLFGFPDPTPRRTGRPRKYGRRLGKVTDLAASQRAKAQTYQVHVYGAQRDVLASDQCLMLKTLRCPVRVVWVYRQTQWVALMTTDLSLTVEQIIEYYSARWKIEAGFREIKQEIGSAYTQTRNPDAVTNHLQFCLLATTLTWIYAASQTQAPARRYTSEKRPEYAFGDVRRLLAQDIANGSFGMDCPVDGKTPRNSLISAVMRLIA